MYPPFLTVVSVENEMPATSISADSISNAPRDPNQATQWLFFLEDTEDLMFNIIGSISSAAS